MIVTRTEVPIYCGMLHVVFSECVLKDKVEINKKFNDTIRDDADFCAQTDSRRNHFLAVFDMKNIKNDVDLIETIAHESVHLTSFLFNRKGIIPDIHNDEPQAYLLGWFSAQIYKTYLKYKAQQDVKKV